MQQIQHELSQLVVQCLADQAVCQEALDQVTQLHDRLVAILQSAKSVSDSILPAEPSPSDKVTRLVIESRAELDLPSRPVPQTDVSKRKRAPSQPQSKPIVFRSRRIMDDDDDEDDNKMTDEDDVIDFTKDASLANVAKPPSAAKPASSAKPKPSADGGQAAKRPKSWDSSAELEVNRYEEDKRKWAAREQQQQELAKTAGGLPVEEKYKEMAREKDKRSKGFIGFSNEGKAQLAKFIDIDYRLNTKQKASLEEVKWVREFLRRAEMDDKPEVETVRHKMGLFINVWRDVQDSDKRDRYDAKTLRIDMWTLQDYQAHYAQLEKDHLARQKDRGRDDDSEDWDVVHDAKASQEPPNTRGNRLADEKWIRLIGHLLPKHKQGAQQAHGPLSPATIDGKDPNRVKAAYDWMYHYLQTNRPGNIWFGWVYIPREHEHRNLYITQDDAYELSDLFSEARKTWTWKDVPDMADYEPIVRGVDMMRKRAMARLSAKAADKSKSVKANAGKVKADEAEVDKTKADGVELKSGQSKGKAKDKAKTDKAQDKAKTDKAQDKGQHKSQDKTKTDKAQDKGKDKAQDKGKDKGKDKTEYTGPVVSQAERDLINKTRKGYSEQNLAALKLLDQAVARATKSPAKQSKRKPEPETDESDSDIEIV